jgi:hypothetical protein
MSAGPPISEIETAVLEAVTQRLEAALALVAGASAVEELDDIAALCDEAAILARAGRILLGPAA